jgi:hypothetical protein
VAVRGRERGLVVGGPGLACRAHVAVRGKDDRWGPIFN